MDTSLRTNALSILVLASLCGCGAVQPVASSVERVASRIFHPNALPQAAPPSPSLDAYKTQVAQHVVQQNPAQTFSGRLPPMLPAIVVLNITVDKDGQLTELAVQRSRDPDASRVALASMRRSAPLPPPDKLLARNSDSLTFSETFLFNDQYQFQLRTLSGAQ
jgi:periplasmic protein TonB